MSDAHRGSLNGTYQCDCGAVWPEFLRLRIDLPGCPACNDAWARWPASARTDTDVHGSRGSRGQSRDTARDDADAVRAASARATDADREPERERDAVLTAGAE